MGLLALQCRNCEKSLPITQVTVLAKVLFVAVHTNPGRLKPVSIVFTTSQKITLESGFKKVFLRKIKSLLGSLTRTPHESFA